MAITNFTVNFDLYASATDSDDAGTDADIIPLVGEVTFRPVMRDRRPALAPSYSPRPAGFVPREFVGYLDTDGRLKDAAGGTPGVRLWANDPVLELTELNYEVKFNVTTTLGEAVSVQGGYITAPSTDTTVNLADVLQQTGSAGVGVTKGEKGDAGTVSIGTVTTGAAGSSAAVTATGTPSAAVLNFTIPRGDTGSQGPAATVAVGTVTTGNAGSSATVTNSGTSGAAVLDFAIPRGDTGAAATVAVGTVTTGSPGSAAVVTNSGTSGAAVLDFTIPQGIAGSATINGITATELGRLVATTSGGSSATDNWTKLANFATTGQYAVGNFILALAQKGGVGLESAVISVAAGTFTSANAPLAAIQMISKSGTGAIGTDSFKLISGAYGTDIELWMRKDTQFSQFAVYEVMRSVAGVTATYHNNSAWQSATPTGAVNNVSTNGVTAFGVPVLTTTNTATVTNKTLTSPRINQINDTNGNPLVQLLPTASAVNYLTFQNASAGNTVRIYGDGSDSNVSITMFPKGGGAFSVYAPTGVTPRVTASGADTNVSLNLVPKGTGTVQANGVDVVTTTGVQSLSGKTLTSPTLSTPTVSGSTATAASITAAGSDTNIDLSLAGKGTGGVRIPTIKDSNGNIAATFSATASAVNYLDIRNAATGSAVVLVPNGSDSNCNLVLRSKGASGLIQLSPNASNAVQVIAASTPVNWWRVYSSNTGSDLEINATGADTNVSANITTRGTGVVKANGVEVATVSGTQTLSNKRLASATVPATTTSTGTTGEIAYDSTHVYICTATNTWRRASLGTW